MHKILLIICLFVGLNFAFSQTNFIQRIGTDFKERSNCGVQTFDDNFVISGQTFGFGSAGNPFLIKLDQNGNILWAKDYPGINEDKIMSIIELPNHHLAITGYTHSYGAGYTDVFVMETDTDGTVLWARTYGEPYHDYGLKIVYEGGSFYVNMIRQGVAFGVMKLDSIGNILWGRVNSSLDPSTPLGYDVFKSDILPIGTGGVLICSTGNCRKYSSSGVNEWAFNFNPMVGWTDMSLAESSTGDIYLSMNFDNAQTVDLSIDFCILKLTSSGNLIWSKSYGGTYGDEVTSMIINDQDQIVVSGLTQSAGNGDYDAFIANIDLNGNVNWAKTYGSEWMDVGLQVNQSFSDHGYIITGESFSHGLVPDSAKAFVVRTDSVGNSLCNSVSWFPIMNNQTVLTYAIDTTTAWTDMERNPLPWAPVNRVFYQQDLCNEIAALDELIIGGKIMIYPNPCTDKAIIKLVELNNQTAQISVRNLIGEEILQCDWDIDNSDYKNYLNSENWDPGVYFIEFMIAGKKEIKKVIKQ